MKDGTFTADRLLALYDRVAEAEDAIPRLRRFVLDLAVRGRLVEQNPSDEPAAELLKRIAKEKARIGIRHPPEGYEATDLPFALPRGWALSCIGEVCSKTGSGSTPRGGKEVYSDSGIPFLRSQNVYDDGLRLDDVALIATEIHERMSGTAVKPADLLLNITGGSMGRCCRIPDDFGEANVSQHVAIIRAAIPGMADFLHRLVLSPYFQAFIFGEQTGAGRGGLPKNRMDRIAVALPPLAEQRRIVAKVEELMALCDRLEAARAGREAVRDRLTAATWARLTAPEADAEALPAEVGTGSASGNATTKSTFPTHARAALQTLPTLTTRPDQIKTLRQTILNLAVRGKLVAQDPTDEPAAELLKRIALEKVRLAKAGQIRKPKQQAPVSISDAPFAIPSGWALTRLGSVIDLLSGQHLQPPEYSEKEGAGVPYITGPSDFQHGGLSITRFALVRKAVARKGQLLLTVKGSGVGKTTICNLPEVAISRQLMALTPILWTIEFLEIITHRLAENLQSQARSLIPGIAREDVEDFVLPLPPLAEQHRIVAKVDALMALCDQLEASLTTATTTRSRLLEALLHESLEPASESMEAAE